MLNRAELVVGLGLAMAASWAFVAWMTTDMSHPFIRLMMPFSSSWSLATVGAVFLMWSAMMVAMMLPSAAPMILTFDAAERRRAGLDGLTGRTLVFLAAYLTIWVVFSALATAAQWGLQTANLLTPMIVSKSDWLTAGLLVLAGLYQWSPLKQACLRSCRTPMGFMMTEWREGLGGAWRMGLKHGLYCTGCCWALMLLLFVAGAMNPGWIVFLTVLVALEKWPRVPLWSSYALGSVLIVGGLVQAL
ncbi:DUF2182 domain-containing protein [Sedimentitalea sp. JM2-8]|uniref:DUF2182 domain-containing protein n=1 Tax=Sedimentitalea xiamensis TaxID=3050037 RepID=A0ABT7FBT3_9RHOB|nr:DUF2182 domain-containing protein [Sedimentitalea xiamensis]MDK3072559.1 DUF2182 domain-containing protein [Sedimentitalea xiamensis]